MHCRPAARCAAARAAVIALACHSANVICAVHVRFDLCRYPPQPRFAPFAFYSAVRLGDPEQLALIMETDPYFLTQDNGAGAPLHFATTYKQLDMVRVSGGIWRLGRS